MIADSLLSAGARPLAMDIVNLVAVDDPADYGVLPVIIGSNQSASAVVQLQCRISQCIGNAILSELRAYGTNNYPLWFGPLNNETSDHHVVACLNKGARTDVA